MTTSEFLMLMVVVGFMVGVIAVIIAMQTSGKDKDE